MLTELSGRSVGSTLSRDFHPHPAVLARDSRDEYPTGEAPISVLPAATKELWGNRLVNTEDRTGRTYGTERTYGLKSNPGAQQAPAEHRTLEHPEIMLYQGRQMSIISLPAEADRRPSH